MRNTIKAVVLLVLLFVTSVGVLSAQDLNQQLYLVPNPNYWPMEHAGMLNTTCYEGCTQVFYPDTPGIPSYVLQRKELGYVSPPLHPDRQLQVVYEELVILHEDLIYLSTISRQLQFSWSGPSKEGELIQESWLLRQDSETEAIVLTHHIQYDDASIDPLEEVVTPYVLAYNPSSEMLVELSPDGVTIFSTPLPGQLLVLGRTDYYPDSAAAVKWDPDSGNYLSVWFAYAVGYSEATADIVFYTTERDFVVSNMQIIVYDEHGVQVFPFPTQTAQPLA